jgi:DNA-binding ferritin-like protein
MSDHDDKNVLDIYDDMLAGRIKLAQEAPTSDASKILCSYLAMQRVMYIVFQHAHWKCKCPAFYGNHLLFERVYKDVRKLVDTTAEKIIGVFGNDSLNHENQVEMIAGMYKYTSEDHVENSLMAAKDFLKLADEAYNRIKEMGDMTLGLDDMIMSQCNEVEEYVYLLSQASPGGETREG